MKRLLIGLGLLCLLALPLGVLADSAETTGRVSQTSFTAEFDALDSSTWLRSGVWSNGTPFANVWLPGHVTFSNSNLQLNLDDKNDAGGDCPTNCDGKEYASATYRTHNYYSYGCFEARFKPVKQSGVVTALFTFNGVGNAAPDGDGTHNEIDIEFLGKDTTRFQTNYYTQGSASNEHIVDLGFDAADDFHNYGFKWTENGISWYVDGAVVYSVTDSASVTVPKVASGGSQKIFMNMWPIDNANTGAALWAGSFTYAAPVVSEYQWFRYEAGDLCSFSTPLSVGIREVGVVDGVQTNVVVFAATLSLLTGTLYIALKRSQI